MDGTIIMYEKISVNLAIVETIWPRVESLFIEKGKDYQEGFAFLGKRGQFSDINRKFWKLKRALWDDEPLVGESAEEILMDMIGHCLLTLWVLECEKP